MAELTQQIFDYVFTQYGTKPEYLWKTHPDYAVLRHADNRKWYAIVMNVEKTSLGLNGSGKLSVMNVKCSPEMLSLFLSQSGFLPAYHMNKNHWLTVLLDGSVEKDTVLFLLNASFDLTATRKVKKQLGIARYTVLPFARFWKINHLKIEIKKSLFSKFKRSTFVPLH